MTLPHKAPVNDIHVSAPARQILKQDAGGRVLIVIMSLFAYNSLPIMPPHLPVVPDHIGGEEHPKR